MAHGIKVIVGTHQLPSQSPEIQAQVFEVLKAHNVKYLDTAAVYAGADKLLGDFEAGKTFQITVKAPGFAPGALSRESILAAANKTFKELGVSSVELYLLHSPDSQTPIEETLETVQELYKAGKFKQFGVSNYKVEDLKKIHALCSERGYVLPTVYQGNYNAVARHIEKDLFPTLRELGIAFDAYSPLAGGFLVKSTKDIEDGVGRFDRNTVIGKLYFDLYAKPAMLEALNEWEAISKESGISKSALGYKWVVYHSALSAEKGDGIILGARTAEPLDESLRDVEDGPLPAKFADRISAIWDKVKDVAPVDNFNG